MFCPYCGTQLPAGAAFCGECGARVATPATPPRQAPPVRSESVARRLPWRTPDTPEACQRAVLRSPFMIVLACILSYLAVQSFFDLLSGSTSLMGISLNTSMSDAQAAVYAGIMIGMVVAFAIYLFSAIGVWAMVVSGFTSLSRARVGGTLVQVSMTVLSIVMMLFMALVPIAAVSSFNSTKRHYEMLMNSRNYYTGYPSAETVREYRNQWLEYQEELITAVVVLLLLLIMLIAVFVSIVALISKIKRNVKTLRTQGERFSQGGIAVAGVNLFAVLVLLYLAYGDSDISKGFEMTLSLGMQMAMFVMVGCLALHHHIMQVKANQLLERAQREAVQRPETPDTTGSYIPL